MNAEVRIFNRDNIFGRTREGGRVEIFADGEWHDVSHRVSGVSMNLVAGDVARCSVTFVMPEFDIEGSLDGDTVGVMAAFLRERGWTVEAPA